VHLADLLFAPRRWRDGFATSAKPAGKKAARRDRLDLRSSIDLLEA
jgi:hypothetical protein